MKNPARPHLACHAEQPRADSQIAGLDIGQRDVEPDPVVDQHEVDRAARRQALLRLGDDEHRRALRGANPVRELALCRARNEQDLDARNGVAAAQLADHDRARLDQHACGRERNGLDHFIGRDYADRERAVGRGEGLRRPFDVVAEFAQECRLDLVFDRAGIDLGPHRASASETQHEAQHQAQQASTPRRFEFRRRRNHGGGRQRGAQKRPDNATNTPRPNSVRVARLLNSPWLGPIRLRPVIET